MTISLLPRLLTMLDSPYLVLAALLSTTVGLWITWRFTSARGGDRALPPGPPTLPVIGNLLDMSPSAPHFQFSEWARKYGEIFTLKMAHVPVIVLSSHEAIEEVLEKNAAATADRPDNHIVNIVCDGQNVALARYSQTWRSLRRGAHGLLTTQSCREHLIVQRAEGLQLSYELLMRPENFLQSIRRFTFSVISSILYGKRVTSYDSPEASALFDMIDLWIRLLTPGSVPPLDLFPILKWVPSRFAQWKRLSRAVRTAQRAVYFGMLDDFKVRLGEGRGNNCFMEGVLDNASAWGLTPDLTAYLGGVLIEAGSDTTAAFLQSFILLLVAHPDVQARAQKEIDEVVGAGHMPTLDDFAKLPYLQAVVSETHRFRPVAPLTVPHAATQDIRYGQYVIPKGSVVFANAWGVFHNEDMFSDPDTYNPDRFLAHPEHMKVTDLIFGTGRRSCPGIHLAKNAIAMNTMNLVWGFNLSKARDAHGNTIELDISDYVQDLASHPNPYQCRIETRSSARADIIREEFAGASEVFRAYE